ncbi:MAG: Rid family detoxifying hydrolase [Coriobacteriales bacterium]|jgi:2-iminobutanoate/2-iminopropanoate deaminase|nr:Rid family detoxifying hydrolase [Coriobacteriales bacterium]
MQRINTSEAPAAIGPYSQAVVSGGLVFTSGQIPLDPASGAIPKGIEAQAHRALQNLVAVLEAAGSSASAVLKTTCFLADMADFATFNTIYEQYLPGKPARSCVAVRSLPKGVLVEVEAVAEV